jgi:hypothetical protein
MGTPRSELRQAFYDMIESDTTFHQYYADLEESEIEALSDERANTYIKKAIARLRQKGKPEISLAIDVETDTFVETLTDDEVLLIGGDLAFEVYIGRGVAKLKTLASTFPPSDMKALTHSPANERNSVMAMYKQLQSDNDVKISDYYAKDRATGEFKSPNSEGVGYDT